MESYRGEWLTAADMWLCLKHGRPKPSFSHMPFCQGNLCPLENSPPSSRGWQLPVPHLHPSPESGFQPGAWVLFLSQQPRDPSQVCVEMSELVHAAQRH